MIPVFARVTDHPFSNAMNLHANHECGGITEFAHITTGGTAIKGSDLHGINLCTNHHTAGPGAYHRLGSVESFDSVHGTNLWKANAELLAEWVRRMKA